MKNIVVILASVALLCSCNDDKTDDNGGRDAQIALTSSAVEFFATGDVATGENTVTITSSDDWRLTGKKGWCTPSAVAGKSGDEVTFIAEENPEHKARSVVFTLFTGNKTQEFTVTQRASIDMDMSQDEFDISASGESDIKIRIVSGVAWTAEIDADAQGWVSLPSARSAQTSYIHLKVAANDTYGARSGKVVLRGEGIEPSYITINQAQNDALTCEQREYKQPLAQSTIRVTVWSNIPYAVQIPEAAKSWLTLQAQPSVPTAWSSQELVFNLAAAAEYRISSITIASTDGKVSIPLSIQQGEPVTFPIPDPNFRQYLLDSGFISELAGGYVTTAAGAAATKIDAYETLWGVKGCESLEGIENFQNMTTLICWYGRIRILDVSKNLKLTGDISQWGPNPFEELHLPPSIAALVLPDKLYNYNEKTGSYPTTYTYSERLVVTGEELQMINVSNNKLKTLDVSGCPNLYDLRCQQTGQTLTTITMSEAQRGNVNVTKDGNTNIVYK